MEDEKQDIGTKIRENLLTGDFDFGKKQYEPTVCEPIDTHAPIRPRLIRYLKDQYGSSGKLDHHDESLNRILGLGRDTLHALQEQDESETAKVYTLCSTLTAARKNWAALLSDRDKGFISDFPLPQPEDDCHVLPELGKHQAMNTAQSRYFFHALLAGMPPSERERYGRLYAKEWRQFAQPSSRLSNGMDAVVLQIELALQRAFGHFLSKVPGFDEAGYLPDHGATWAGEQTLALANHLLPHSPAPQQDLLRAALIKNGAIHVATNQINGILRAYDEVAKALPPELERCRGITVARHADIAPMLTALLNVPTPELPDNLVMMAEIVCRMYCAQVGPANPADHAAFIDLHNSPLQITISAILIYDDWRSKREVDKSIRGEKNSQRQIFHQLHNHYLEHKDEVDRGDMIISELTLGEMHFLTARYSIAAFALASDYPIHVGAQAHLNVKRMKHALQRSVCMKLLGLSVADAVRFADTLDHDIKQRIQRPRLRTLPTATLSGTTVRWVQQGW